MRKSDFFSPLIIYLALAHAFSMSGWIALKSATSYAHLPSRQPLDRLASRYVGSHVIYFLRAWAL